MDSTTITYGALGALCLGGLTILKFMWTIHAGIIRQHEKDEAKFAAVYDKLNHEISQVHNRIDRNKSECRTNEKDLQEQVTQLRIDLVKKTDLKVLEESIEGNVSKTVDTRIAQLEAKIPQMMMEVLKTFKPSS